MTAAASFSVTALDDAVDGAELLDRRVDEALIRSPVADVGGARDVADSEVGELAREIIETLAPPRGHDESRAALAEVSRHAAADSLARAGDDDDAAVERIGMRHHATRRGSTPVQVPPRIGPVTMGRSWVDSTPVGAATTAGIAFSSRMNVA